MYYIDGNGVMILIPFGGKIKKEGWMVILKIMIENKSIKVNSI